MTISEGASASHERALKGMPNHALVTLTLPAILGYHALLVKPD